MTHRRTTTEHDMSLPWTVGAMNDIQTVSVMMLYWDEAIAYLCATLHGI